jgi:hypothetical protein
MSQTPEEQPATARAEALLGSLGRRFDLFAAQAGQRMQNIATSIREEADRMDQPATASGEKAHSPLAASAEERGKLAMTRAEEEMVSVHFTNKATQKHELTPFLPFPRQLHRRPRVRP